MTHSVWPGALTLGAVAAAATAGPSLFPHDPKYQAYFAGGLAVVGTLAGAGIGGVAARLAKHAPGGRTGALAALAGVGLLTAAGVRMTGADRRSDLLAGAGTAGLVAATTAVASLAAAAIAPRIPGPAILGKLLVPAIAGGAVLAIGKRDASTPIDYLLPEIDLPKVDPNEKLATRTLERLDVARAMPGVDPATVQLDKLPKSGQRFLFERTSAEEIATTMGKPAVADPRRVYVGLDEAPEGIEEPQLIEWMTDRAIERLEQSGGFERSRIVVIPTTSTGYINPQAPMTHEMMSLGDVATVGLQAGHKKAVLELHNLDRSVAMHERLLAKINDRIRQLPADKRPAIDVYGESFGAWTSQSVFEGKGVGALDEHGIAHAMYVGSPLGSKWRREVSGQAGAVALRSGASSQDITAESARGTRVTFLTHDADPVANFSAGDLWRRPEWLPASGPRGEKIPEKMRYWPLVTGLQVVIDQQLAQGFRDGVVEAKAHDYRAEVAYVMRRAYGYDQVTDQQVARVREFGRQGEMRWIESEARVVK